MKHYNTKRDANGLSAPEHLRSAFSFCSKRKRVANGLCNLWLRSWIMSNINYFLIEDILATQTRVPCKLEVEIQNLGFLDPSAGKKHIASGVKLEVPFWLARGLCARNRKIISVELPTAYRRSYRDIFSADAKVVDLHKLGPHYYDFGLRLMGLPHPELRDVGICLIETFKNRFRFLLDWSQNSFSGFVQSTARLDELEKALFNTGQKCLMDFQSWQSCQADKITISAMIANHRKRKRNELEDERS